MVFKKFPLESIDCYPLKNSLWCYVLSLLIMSIGSIMAARYYPDGYDWLYTAASALASQKHNPTGSIWFAVSLILSMLLLWPYVSALKKSLYTSSSVVTNFTIGALRTGLVCGVLVGVERLFIRDFSHWLYKAHESLALLMFLGFYLGILGLLIKVIHRNRNFIIPVLFIASPLLVIGILQFWLYLDLKGLGWLDTSWREQGVPVWLSFAFWQWLAIGFLWAGLGLLNFLDLTNK